MTGPVDAVVHYCRSDCERVVAHPSLSYSDPIFDARCVSIADAREIVQPPELRRDGPHLSMEGFMLVRHAPLRPTAHDDGVAGWCASVRSMLRQLTGAALADVRHDRVIRRAAERDDSTLSGYLAPTLDRRPPLRFAHSDFNAAMFASVPRYHRAFMCVHVWQPIGDTVRDMPLAILDRRTVAREDLIPLDLQLDDRAYCSDAGLVVRYNPAHRWFYFPLMQIDEALLWVGWDPRRWHTAPHCAISLPDQINRARQNIDVRAMLVW